MKAIKAVATVYVYSKDGEQSFEHKEAYLPDADGVIAASEMSVEMYEQMTNQRVTLTKLVQSYDKTKIELEYHMAADGMPHLMVVGEEVEIDKLPPPEIPEPIKRVIEKMMAEQAAAELQGVPKDQIN
jgi:hypothetical protein